MKKASKYVQGGIKLLVPRTPQYSLFNVKIERYMRFFFKLLPGLLDGSSAMPFCLAFTLTRARSRKRPRRAAGVEVNGLWLKQPSIVVSYCLSEFSIILYMQLDKGPFIISVIRFGGWMASNDDAG